MIEMAIEKLKQEYKKAKGDQYGAVVKKPLLDVLCEFCKQDGEFAQAVVQGGAFEQALAAAVKGARNHTPDIQIYRQAAQFYFPGCEIALTVKIDLCGNVDKAVEDMHGVEKKEASAGFISLDLTSFL